MPTSATGTPDFSRKPTTEGYEIASDTTPAQTYAGEEFYNPETGKQEVQTAAGMSSAGGCGTVWDTVTGQEVSTEIGWQAQEEQLGGKEFDWSDYKRSTQAPVTDVSQEVGDQPVDTTTDTMPPVVTDDPNQKAYDNFSAVYNQPLDFVKKNFAQIQLIDALKVPGQNKQAIIGLIGKTPANFPIDQKGSIDFWKGEGTFYGQTMKKSGLEIGGTLNFGDGNNWAAILDWFAENKPNVPPAQVMYDLSTQAANWPRNNNEANNLASAVGGAPVAKDKGPVFRDADTTRGAWDKSVGAIQANWGRNRYNVDTTEGQDILLNDLRKAYVEGLFGIGYKWEEQLVDYEYIKARPNRSFGGLSLAQIDETVGKWYDAIIQGKRAEEVVPSGITTGPDGKPVIPQGEPGPVVAGDAADWAGDIPTTVDGMAKFLGTISQDHQYYSDFVDLYQTMLSIENSAGGAGGSSDALADMAVQLRSAQIKVLNLQNAAGITALQSKALQDWQKSLQETSVKATEQRNLLEARGQRAAATGQMDIGVVNPITGVPYTQETIESRRLRELEAQGVQAREFEEAAIGRASEERIAQQGVEAERLAQATKGAEQQTLQAQQAKTQADTALVAMENARDMAKAELTGIHAGLPTLAHKELEGIQRLREAEMSGKLQQMIGGTVLSPEYKEVDTIAYKTYVLNNDMQRTKMRVEEELSRAANTRENIRLNYETVRLQNQTYIARGQLQEAVQSMREMNRIKEVEMEDARNTMRLNTLMSLMNPVAMLMAQRMGMIPQLEAAMGIDLDLPEIPQMLPDGMTVPTSQMLNLFSPQDQQLIMAESSFRTGLSPEDVWSVIHKQRPGAPGGALRTYAGGR